MPFQRWNAEKTTGGGGIKMLLDTRFMERLVSGSIDTKAITFAILSINHLVLSRVIRSQSYRLLEG